MTQKEIEQITAVVEAAVRKITAMGQKELLTVEEAALYMGLTKNTLYKLTHNRQIPHYKPNGKMCYFKRTELEQWLATNPVATADDIATQANSYCMKNKANI
ncbi:MAG: helix-turn-helix domain-containing protein [Muribaculaceae bacterium]|nr:helix-turn-helix domain-containing protein [Muribaculaceae bacterium]